MKKHIHLGELHFRSSVPQELIQKVAEEISGLQNVTPVWIRNVGETSRREVLGIWSTHIGAYCTSNGFSRDTKRWIALAHTVAGKQSLGDWSLSGSIQIIK